MTSLTDLYDFAEKKNIKIDYFHMNEIAAISFPDGRIVMNNQIKTSTEEKIYLAHELGHCETGCFYNINTESNTKSKYEASAARWAIKKLISKKELLNAICSGLKEIWELAEHFEVPEHFIRKAVEYYKLERGNG